MRRRKESHERSYPIKKKIFPIHEKRRSAAEAETSPQEGNLIGKKKKKNIMPLSLLG